MTALERLEKREIKELLSKGWLTHDAMWFLHCLNEIGMEKTNKINKAAVRSMSEIEMSRIKRALGHTDDAIRSFDDLVRLFNGAMELVKADFMRFKYDIPSENVIHWEMEEGECFAYKGMTRMGVIDQYECGILCRIDTWLDTLGVKHTMNPPVKGCLMHESGRCAGDIITDL